MATALVAHRPTWRSVDRYIALTGPIADHLRAYGIPDARIVVRPNSVPDPGPLACLGDGFLYLGRLSEEKGVRILVAAWQRHADGALGVLRIAGDGPLRDLVTELGRADVQYLGTLDPSGVQEAMRASAVVLAPSLWPDVLPTVVLEALAAGRPVLGTDVGGIPYAIGPAGWTVRPSVEALADALPQARAQAAGLAPAARRRYERTFHPGVAVPRLLAIYAATSSTYSASRPRT
jgi:glycosyltransferase involved in cell wall biosynthesis